jgi:hypothetical protein
MATCDLSAGLRHVRRVGKDLLVLTITGYDP